VSMCGNGETTGSAMLWPGLARLLLFMTRSQSIAGPVISPDVWRVFILPVPFLAFCPRRSHPSLDEVIHSYL
jgi:hypothetical protein